MNSIDPEFKKWLDSHPAYSLIANPYVLRVMGDAFKAGIDHACKNLYPTVGDIDPYYDREE